MKRLLLALALALVAQLAPAKDAAPLADDPVAEKRLVKLSEELRCLVCQNQTVADSDAPVARDLRDQVRAQLAAGKSEDEVKQYMTDRFGDFVLYKPPLKATTVALWAGPFAVLLLAAFLLARRLRQTAASAQGTLAEADRARARALLDDPPTPLAPAAASNGAETQSRAKP